ncbi:hypothetical protein AURDEDRAFT_189000 [Auricularia subglabra TFB-10046 SS5]|nr:hypothetical protein AURDEDRAFT_189000 [Auricularia subglabra TFB-10046 SS5]
MCETLPTSLTTLRTLRLWHSHATIFESGNGMRVDGLDREEETVRIAHKRCRTLKHVSLSSRNVWHRISGIWVPVAHTVTVKGDQVAAAREWVQVHFLDELLSPEREAVLEAAETDSLINVAPDYRKRRRGWEGWVDVEDVVDSSMPQESDSHAWHELDEELALAHAEEQSGPSSRDIRKGLDSRQDDGADMANDRTRVIMGRRRLPPTDRTVAILLQKISAVRQERADST